MAELSPGPAERARTALASILQSLQEPGTQRNVAQVLGVSESTVSRIKTEKLEDVVTLLYQLGYKVVRRDMKCYPSEYVQALHTMARMHMSEDRTLEWDT